MCLLLKINNENSKQNETLNHSMHHAYKSNAIKDFLKKLPFIFNLLNHFILFYFT